MGNYLITFESTSSPKGLKLAYFPMLNVGRRGDKFSPRLKVPYVVAITETNKVRSSRQVSRLIM